MESYSIKTENIIEFNDEQFFQLCAQNKEIPFELDKNKNILIMSPTGTLTGNYHSEFIGELRNWNKRYKLGYCFDSSAGFTLPNGAMRAPDVAWIEKQKWKKIPTYDKNRFAHICPDFLIEVLSKTDSLKKHKEKMQEWIDNGCRLAWLIDMKNKKIHIYKPGRNIINQNFDKELNGEDVLPGFELDMKEIL